MWDGPDVMGFDSVGEAMQSVAMQDNATPCHATPWDWMEFDGMGSDAMRRDAMGLDFFHNGWVESVMLVARRPSTMARWSAARSRDDKMKMTTNRSRRASSRTPRHRRRPTSNQP